MKLFRKIRDRLNRLDEKPLFRLNPEIAEIRRAYGFYPFR